MKQFIYCTFLSLIFSFFPGMIHSALPPVPLQSPQMMSPMGGQQGLPPELMMSEEEWNQVFEYLSTLDEKQLKELEEYGRQVLTEVYGLDPDTLQPLPGGPKGQQPSPMQQMPQRIPEPKEPEKIIPVENKAEMRLLIEGLHNHLASLRGKISLVSNELPPLSWLSSLQSLIVYLGVLNKNEHYERLLAPENAELLESLKKLYQTTLLYEPLFIPFSMLEGEFEDNPYEILGISQYANQQHIERAYQRLAEKKNPERIKQHLEAQGMNAKDIKRALKEAHLSMSIIEDAYEKLKDPKVREYIDRELAALAGQNEQIAFETVQAFNTLNNTLTQSLNQQQLVPKIEAFLKKHEPQEFARKKELMDAQTKRRQEQEVLSHMRPMPTPGGPYEQRRPTQPSFGTPPGNFGYDYPSMGHPYGAGTVPSPFSNAPFPPEPTKQLNENASKPKPVEDKIKTNDQKAVNTKKEQKQRAQFEKEQKPINEMLNALEKDCKRIHTTIHKPATQSFFSQFPAYMKKSELRTRKAKALPVASPLQEISSPALTQQEKTGKIPLSEEEETTPEVLPSENQPTETEATLLSSKPETEVAPSIGLADETSIRDNTNQPASSPPSEEPTQAQEESAERNVEQENIQPATDPTPEEVQERRRLFEERITREANSKRTFLESFIKEIDLKGFEKNLDKFKKLMSKKEVLPEQKAQALEKWYTNVFIKCQPEFDKLFKQINSSLDTRTIHPIKRQLLLGSAENVGPLATLRTHLEKLLKEMQEIDKLLRPQKPRL